MQLTNIWVLSRLYHSVCRCVTLRLNGRLDVAPALRALDIWSGNVLPRWNMDYVSVSNSDESNRDEYIHARFS